MRRLGLLSAVLVLTQGCALLGVQAISRPALEAGGPHRMDDEGWVALARARIAVAARNDRATAAFIGPAPFVPLPIFPLPPSALETRRPEATFWVDVAIDPEGEDFVFDPADVRLNLGETADLRPVRMRGPASVIRGAGRRHTSALCGGDEAARPISDVALTQLACVSLEFDMVPPAPDVPFTVSVRGLSDRGTPVEVPTVRFTKGHRATLDALP